MQEVGSLLDYLTAGGKLFLLPEGGTVVPLPTSAASAPSWVCVCVCACVWGRGRGREITGYEGGGGTTPGNTLSLGLQGIVEHEGIGS